MPRSAFLTALVLALATGAVCPAVSAQSASTTDGLSLQLQAGQLVGLRVGRQTLAAQGVGGFYVQPYQAVTGPDLLREQGIAGIPAPLPRSFAVDTKMTWRGRPTLTIRLPETKAGDSGELELHVDQVQPHRVYLIRFAHRGERLAGEYPPILHIRQSDPNGQPVTSQLNVDLPAGTYDWKEEVIPVPAVDRAASFTLMLHHPSGSGQFWISEVTVTEVRQQPAMPVVGTWTGGVEPQFTGTVPDTPIVLSARASALMSGMTIRTTLSAPASWLKKNPTALTVSFRVPLAAVGWRWGDSLRGERQIEARRSYSDYQLIGRRQYREVSRFPMAAIAGPDHGIALMAPLKPVILSRFRYDADGYLCGEFDLAVVDQGLGATEDVSFCFDIVRFEPRWGYRSALSAYYTRYSDLFSSTAKEGGWWIGPSDTLQSLQDFGLQYAEAHFAGPEPTKANNGMGIYTCSYSEPWMWRILASEENDLALVKPVSAYLPKIERDAKLPLTVMDTHDYWTAPTRESARAFLNSAVFGDDDTYLENAARTYQGTYIEMNASCLPNVCSSRWGDINRGMLSYRYETLADAERCAAGGAKLDGVYFDSVGNWSDIAAEDHRDDHFPFAATPLTFSYATGTPVVSGLAAMSEYMDFIRRKGYVTMANSDSVYAGYAAPYLDMIGAGENFDDDAASDEALSHDRAVAFRKSVSFGNSGLLQASQQEAVARFKLLLFYHVYPGIFFSDAGSLERLRPLYRRFIPLIRDMGRAGWEPVPWAATEGAPLWVERYGPSRDGRAYFAMRNPTGSTQTTTLAVEASGFGRPVSASVRVVDALSGKPLDPRRSVNKLTIPVSVPPRDTAVVRVDWPG